MTQVIIARVSGTIPARTCDAFPFDGGLAVIDAVLLRFYDDGRNITAGTYVVTPANNPDAGKKVDLQFQSSGAGGYFVGAVGTVSLTQAGSGYSGSFSAGLVQIPSSADGGRLDGTFFAPFCP